MAESMWIVPFGKHKGKPIEDLDRGYLEWLLEQDWFVEQFDKGKEAVEQELGYRDRFGTGSEPDTDKHWNRR